MGKPTICICENKGADQLRGNRAPTINVLSKYIKINQIFPMICFQFLMLKKFSVVLHGQVSVTTPPSQFSAVRVKTFF